MEVRSKVYTYRTAVKWTEQKKGTITCEGKPDIQVATPPEFKGHEGIWSPEDLYVASANICLMTTFWAVAERAGLAFTSYHCEAVSYTHLRAHETVLDLVCRLLLEKKKEQHNGHRKHDLNT